MELGGVNTFAQGMKKGEEKRVTTVTGRCPRVDETRPIANPRSQPGGWLGPDSGLRVRPDAPLALFII